MELIPKSNLNSKSHIINPELQVIEIYGPIIVILISAFDLYKKDTYLFFYIIGIGFNTILNLFLKSVIRQPRPSLNNINFGFTNSIDKYGMPSGHAQNLGFSIGFMYIFIKKSYILWVVIIISLITMFQRYVNNKHSIIQLFIGYIFGILIGFLFYKLGSHYIKGNLSLKKDDCAFIF